MGFLSKIASKAAKSVVPKILIGGDKEDRKAVQAVVKTGVADPVFQKFGDHLEQGVKLTAGIVAGAVGGGLLGKIGSPTPVTGGNSGIAGALVKSNSKSVGLLDTITKGINKVDAFSKTAVGSQLIGTLGKVVSNLATPSVAKPSDVPQKLALQQGTTNPILETIGQAAVFQGKGVRVEVGNGSTNGDTWWNKNKSWALPALLAVPGFFMFLFLLFGGRRRR